MFWVLGMSKSELFQKVPLDVAKELLVEASKSEIIIQLIYLPGFVCCGYVCSWNNISVMWNSTHNWLAIVIKIHHTVSMTLYSIQNKKKILIEKMWTLTNTINLFFPLKKNWMQKTCQKCCLNAISNIFCIVLWQATQGESITTTLNAENHMWDQPNSRISEMPSIFCGFRRGRVFCLKLS